MPPEVQVEHKKCITISGTPVHAILDQKNLTGLAEEVQRRSKYGPEWALLIKTFGFGALSRPLNGSKSKFSDNSPF